MKRKTHEELCDQIMEDLINVRDAVNAVKYRDKSAVAKLQNACRRLSYEGYVFCVPLDCVLAWEEEEAEECDPHTEEVR